MNCPDEKSAIPQSPLASGSTSGRVRPAPASSPTIIPFRYTVDASPARTGAHALAATGMAVWSTAMPIPMPTELMLEQDSRVRRTRARRKALR